MAVVNMGSIPYDRGNPFHPRRKDVWGRIWRDRWVRVVICDTGAEDSAITVRYVSNRATRRIDLAELLAEWKILSRWSGLEQR